MYTKIGRIVRSWLVMYFGRQFTSEMWTHLSLFTVALHLGDRDDQQTGYKESQFIHLFVACL